MYASFLKNGNAGLCIKFANIKALFLATYSEPILVLSEQLNRIRQEPDLNGLFSQKKKKKKKKKNNNKKTKKKKKKKKKTVVFFTVCVTQTPSTPCEVLRSFAHFKSANELNLFLSKYLKRTLPFLNLDTSTDANRSFSLKSEMEWKTM